MLILTRIKDSDAYHSTTIVCTVQRLCDSLILLIVGAVQVLSVPGGPVI